MVRKSDFSILLEQCPSLLSINLGMLPWVDSEVLRDIARSPCAPRLRKLYLHEDNGKILPMCAPSPRAGGRFSFHCRLMLVSCLLPPFSGVSAEDLIVLTQACPNLEVLNLDLIDVSLLLCLVLPPLSSVIFRHHFDVC